MHFFGNIRSKIQFMIFLPLSTSAWFTRTHPARMKASIFINCIIKIIDFQFGVLKGVFFILTGTVTSVWKYCVLLLLTFLIIILIILNVSTHAIVNLSVFFFLNYYFLHSLHCTRYAASSCDLWAALPQANWGDEWHVLALSLIACVFFTVTLLMNGGGLAPRRRMRYILQVSYWWLWVNPTCVHCFVGLILLGRRRRHCRIQMWQQLSPSIS